MMFERENIIGIILLVLCGLVGLALLFSIGTGNRFRFDGPPWLSTALAVLFIGATIYMFVRTPGRRWPWQRDRGEPPDQQQLPDQSQDQFPRDR
jgi:hypothetical protein